MRSRAAVLCLAVLLVFGMLAVFAAGSRGGGCGDYLRIVVLNSFGASWRLVIHERGGHDVAYESSAPRFVVIASRGLVSRVDFSYVLGKGVRVSYSVVPACSDRIYLVVFPPYFRSLSTDLVYSYSWDCYPWKGAPWGLELMVGTDSSYVEESMAGRIFVLFYGFPYERVRGILDELGIEGGARYEIAATALWAAQLVREARQGAFDLWLCARATQAILERYFGIPSSLAVFLSYAAIPIYLAPRFVSKSVLYRSILFAIWSVRRYVEVFPQWRNVSYGAWVEMCEKLEKYTVEPETPTYAPALVGGAYALYILCSLAEAVELASSELMHLLAIPAHLPP